MPRFVFSRLQRRQQQHDERASLSQCSMDVRKDIVSCSDATTHRSGSALPSTIPLVFVNESSLLSSSSIRQDNINSDFVNDNQKNNKEQSSSLHDTTHTTTTATSALTTTFVESTATAPAEVCGNNDDDDDDDDHNNNNGNNYHTDDDDTHHHRVVPPDTPATSLPSAMVTASLLAPSLVVSSCLSVKEDRPEFLNCRFQSSVPVVDGEGDNQHNTTTTTTTINELGIKLAEHDRGVVIAQVRPDCLLARSNLRPGDRIVAVNDVCCVTVHQVQWHLGQHSADNDDNMTSLTVHHAGGRPGWVSTAVHKVRPTALGIHLQHRVSSHAGAQLLISGVKPDGLVAPSWLTAGHVCGSINGRRGLTAKQARLTIEQTPVGGFVTIVSRPPVSSAMVLSSSTTMVNATSKRTKRSRAWSRFVRTHCGNRNNSSSHVAHGLHVVAL